MLPAARVTEGSLHETKLDAALRQPWAYPFAVDEVGFVETHISRLYFAGDRVYKVKKSVDLGFLDFTSLEARRRCCEDEVRLNRRLAPDVYLGAVPITRDENGRVLVDGDGAVVEWAVEMRRLPEQRMLPVLLDAGEIDNAWTRELAELLARFHAECPTGEGVDEFGAPAAVAANVAENFEQTLPYAAEPGEPAAGGLRALTPRLHAFLKDRAERFLSEHAELFERRVRAGRIREGHGDLHAANICATADGPVVYDCIEFSRRFRCGDVAADLAFLAMDLDLRGYAGFGRYLVRRYAMHAEDRDLERLVPFYKGYRAVVRAKVACFSGGSDASARERAMRYFQLAAAYELPPALVLLCGLPASGKSWLGRFLARTHHAVVLRSDVRRKALAGVSPTRHEPGEFEAAVYSPSMSARTYRSLLESACRSLVHDRSVILDASFSKAEYRAPFVDAAQRLGRPVFLLHVTAPEELVERRLAARARDRREASEANLDVYRQARDRFEAPDELPAHRVVEIRSGDAPAEEHGEALIERMLAGIES